MTGAGQVVEEGLALSHGEVRDANLIKVTREPSLEEVRAQDWDVWGRVWWTQKGMETSVGSEQGGKKQICVEGR